MIMLELIERYLKELDEEAKYYLDNADTPKDFNGDYSARYHVTKNHYIRLNELLFELRYKEGECNE